MTWIGEAEILAHHGPLHDSGPSLVKDYACGLPVMPRVRNESSLMPESSLTLAGPPTNRMPT